MGSKTTHDLDVKQNKANVFLLEKDDERVTIGTLVVILLKYRVLLAILFLTIFSLFITLGLLHKAKYQYIKKINLGGFYSLPAAQIHQNVNIILEKFNQQAIDNLQAKKIYLEKPKTIVSYAKSVLLPVVLQQYTKQYHLKAPKVELTWLPGAGFFNLVGIGGAKQGDQFKKVYQLFLQNIHHQERQQYAFLKQNLVDHLAYCQKQLFLLEQEEKYLNQYYQHAGPANIVNKNNFISLVDNRKNQLILKRQIIAIKAELESISLSNFSSEMMIVPTKARLGLISLIIISLFVAFITAAILVFVINLVKQAVIEEKMMRSEASSETK